MTAKETLTKAISIAIANGWHFPYASEFMPIKVIEDRDSFAIHNGADSREDWDAVSIEATIYNHDFAKALFGEERTWNHAECEEEDGMGYSGYVIPYWQGMLQQMVIADNPIAYLRDNMPEGN